MQFVPIRSKFGENEIESVDYNKANKGPLCYNCDEVGHISINCPIPQKNSRSSKCNKVHEKDSQIKKVRLTL